MAKLTKAEQAERAEAIAKLREMLPPGSKVWTTVNHVARSGMSRRISLYRAVDGEIENITWYVAHALGYTRNRHDGGITVGGCGMDMCFATVYNLSRTLYPDGGSLKHTNPSRRAQEKRAGEKREKDGGYLLHKIDL